MDAPRKTIQRARELRGAMPPPEIILWEAVRAKRLAGLRFRRQHPIGPYILDFFCPEIRLCVEVDGVSHSMGDRGQRDDRRDAWLRAHDIRTLHIPAKEVLSDLVSVTDRILAEARR